MESASGTERIVGIDVAKGLACLLMLPAHLLSARYLPIGTFAAPLFFACSGMNTILLLLRTRNNPRFNLYHLFFPLLLFFGASTQVVIAHGGPLRIFPEFLQCIAMAVLALFLLSKVFRDPLRVGWFFPVPFLVQQLFPLAFYGSPLAFLFGEGFALFPWLGFFLFGVFITRMSQRMLLRMAAVLGAAAVLSQFLSGRPLDRFHMTPAYAFLALTAVCLLFALGRWIAGGSCGFLRETTAFFAVAGRNALMFVYLHYFAIAYLASAELFPRMILYIVLETLYLFFACWVMLLVYERVRHETALLLPTLSLLLALGALRWTGSLNPAADPRLVDMLVGALFAMVYVLLRRRFAASCSKSRAAAA